MGDRTAPDVVFVCVHNAGRSRMAEALFNRAAEGRYTALSAGTAPADRPHPEVVAALAEVGVALPETPGRLLTPELADSAQLLITMGCAVDDACPAAAVPTEDWGLPDPKGQPLPRVREIRDDIAGRVERLLGRLSTARTAASAAARPLADGW